MAPPLDRTALYQLLLALPPPQFEALLFDLNPPKGNVSPPTAPQGQRVPELLTWLESPIGPGLEALRSSLEKLDNRQPPPPTPPRPVRLGRPGLILALASGFAVASLVSVVRFWGALERLELMAYDHVLTVRLPEPTSDRIIVLEADLKVVKAEETKEPKTLVDAISDATLIAAIQKLQEYGASVIGVDWYLPAERDQWSEPVLQVFQTQAGTSQSPTSPDPKDQDAASQSAIYGVCLQPSGRTGDNAVAAPYPQAIPAERVGFSNFATDSDTVLRRHLVSNQLKGNSSVAASPPCQSTMAFSTLMALHYLNTHHADLGPFDAADLLTPSPAERRNRWQLGRTLLEGISGYTYIYGGYQNLEPGAFEIMLNYREPQDNDLRNAFLHQSIYNLFDDQFDPSLVRGKIVLLGLTDNQRASDRFLTPYPNQSDDSDAQEDSREAGVTLQAHMVDHLISLALGERRQIWVWTRGGEFAWILLWSTVGGLLGVVGHKRPWWLAGSLMIGLLGIYLSSRLAMGIVALWLPMVPPMVAFVLAQGTVVYTEAKLQMSRSE